MCGGEQCVEARSVCRAEEKCFALTASNTLLDTDTTVYLLEDPT